MIYSNECSARVQLEVTSMSSEQKCTRLRAVPIFPRVRRAAETDIANGGARKHRQGKSTEARKIGNADSLLFKIKRVRQATQIYDWSVPEIVVNGFFSQQDLSVISDRDGIASISLKSEQKITVNALLIGEDVFIVSLKGSKNILFTRHFISGFSGRIICSVLVVSPFLKHSGKPDKGMSELGISSLEFLKSQH